MVIDEPHNAINTRDDRVFLVNSRVSWYRTTIDTTGTHSLQNLEGISFVFFWCNSTTVVLCRQRQIFFVSLFFFHTPINMTVCLLSCFDYAFDCSLSNLNPFLLWHRQRQHQSAWFAVLVDYPIIVPKHFKPSLRRDAGMMWSALARYKTNPTLLHHKSRWYLM